MFLDNYYKVAAHHNRNWPIDFLRGAMVLLGAYGHFTYIMSYFGIETLSWNWFTATLVYNIPFGIAVFSPVSGFLITSMLLKQSEGNLHNIHIPGFYLQRFTRIMPGLILLCALNLLFYALHYPGFEITHFSWQTILFHIFTFRTNLLFPDMANHLWPWGILWSLAIEEVFYLFFPLICVLLRTHKNVVIFLIAIIFYGPYCRAHAPSAFGSIRLYFGCFDLIAIGALAALLTQNDSFFTKSRKPFRSRIWIGTGIFLMIGTYIFGPWTVNNVCGPTLIAIGVFMYIIGVTYNRKNAPPLKDNCIKSFLRKLILPICIFGLLSYEAYLYHVFIFLLFKPLITWMGAKLGWTWLFSNLWILNLTILTAIASWFWFFHCINPLRKNIVAKYSDKLDYYTYVLIPRLFHRASQQCNFIYSRMENSLSR